MISRHVARALAQAFLAGSLAPDEMAQRGAKVLGQRRPVAWLRRAAEAAALEFAHRRPREHDVFVWLRTRLSHWKTRTVRRIEIVDRLGAPPAMAPLPPAVAWPVPALITTRELADWLGIRLGELEWFADLRGWAAGSTSPRAHYHLRLVRKKSGRYRLLEAPKPRLKAIQRRILRDILAHIPPHDAAHAFRPKRGTASFVAPHVGRAVVVRLDLADFFPTIARARVAALFRTVGYPDAVAAALSGLCTSRAVQEALAANFVAPHSDAERAELRRLQRLHARPHLPQGAPTSPALANLCAWRLDRRLAGLAQASRASYTRYADDLAFSGDDDFARGAARFALHGAAIALEEGFAVNHRKTRIMRRATRQHLAGVVVNDRANVRREEFDRLKAILTNCVRHGPVLQNRAGHTAFRDHLWGRIGYIATWNPRRGEKLKQLFARIDWRR